MNDFGNPPIKTYNYMSYIPNRTPQIKFHTKKAHASSAVICGWPSRAGAAYEFKDGEWVPFRECKVPPCYVCGKELFGYDASVLDYLAIPKESSPLACWACYVKHFSHSASPKNRLATPKGNRPGD